MKILQLLILLLSFLLVTVQPLCAENSGKAPLQLMPGSGAQQQSLPPSGQGVPMSMGEQEQLRDIHPPMPLPEEKNPVLLVAGILVLLLLLAALFWFFRVRKKKVSLPFAHETALTDLLRARTLMTGEQGLLYADTISDILRRYIEDRFRIRSTRQTTKEFFSFLTDHPGQASMLLENHCDSLHACLDQCDLAKFAHCTPDHQGMEHMERAVQDFIESTRENREGDS